MSAQKSAGISIFLFFWVPTSLGLIMWDTQKLCVTHSKFLWGYVQFISAEEASVWSRVSPHTLSPCLYLLGDHSSYSHQNLTNFMFVTFDQNYREAACNHLFQHVYVLTCFSIMSLSVTENAKCQLFLYHQLTLAWANANTKLMYLC